jgi:hypothetical protein
MLFYNGNRLSDMWSPYGLLERHDLGMRQQPAQPVFAASDSASPRARIARSASLTCPNQPARLS